MKEKETFRVEDSDAGMRADKYLSDYTEGISREKLKEVFKSSDVLINGLVAKPSTRLKANDYIEVELPEAVNIEIEAENIPLNIVYEDGDVIVVDKLQGMCVHPAPGNYRGTMVNALLYHSDSLSAINGVIRSGIVHRIDMYTSGLLVAAKNDEAHNFLARQFSAHSVKRAYYAVVHGVLNAKTGIIDAPIGRDPFNRKTMAVTQKNAKRALTHYETVRQNNQFSLLRLRLETGRTHQIRVHMKYIGHPVVGDSLYGRNTAFDRKFGGQLLHAYLLEFIHPRTKEDMEFHSDLPAYFFDEGFRDME